jgi:subtilisin family serine protease
MVLDTGCAPHAWFEPDVVQTRVELDGVPIGLDDPAHDPDLSPDLVGPLDGQIDPVSGHGTFVSGVVLQACPDATILAPRIADSLGRVVESDLSDALEQIAELVQRYAQGLKGGRRIDVLNLSLGYYHETPDDVLYSAALRDVILQITAAGCAVVCSAGNDATSRPMFPAAFPGEPGDAPLLAVGAKNPGGHSVALFSNTAPWVDLYACGVSVLSTFPAFDGGAQAVTRRDAFGQRRESLDPDDFSAGFAVWSGTSFAAPLVSGTIARMLDEAGGLDEQPDAAARAARAEKVVDGLLASGV